MKYLFAAPGHADPAHPEVVPGVSKRHALTGSFTPSRGCSISSSCPFCATESEHRALRRGVERGVDVSHLRVLESARVAAFVADAALLQSAPRCRRAADTPVVDPDTSRLDSRGDRACAAEVAAPHARTQAIDGVVREPDGLLVRVVRLRDQYRAEYLFPHHAHLGERVGEQRRLEVVACLSIGTFPTEDDPGTRGDGLGDVVLDPAT